MDIQFQTYEEVIDGAVYLVKSPIITLEKDKKVMKEKMKKLLLDNVKNKPSK